ncbi:MAG: CHASE4 domain-containing protein [Chloroflexota bacterium]
MPMNKPPASSRPGLSLRLRFLIFIAVVVVLIIGGETILTQTVLQERFNKLEREGVDRNLLRGEEALSREISFIDDSTTDWAAWDDSYAFIQDRNPDYLESNLVHSTFENLKVNYILLFDPAGRMAAGKGYDFKDRQALEIPPGLLLQLSAGSQLVSHAGVDSHKAGILVLPEGIFLLASRPILTSERKGPVRGSLVMARYLDADLMEKLSKLTGLSLSVLRTNAPDLPPEVEAARKNLQAGQTSYVEALNEDSIAGYTALNDIYDRPSLILRIELARDVYQQRKDTMRTLGAFFMGFLILAGLLAFILTDRWIFRRLYRLAGAAKSIGATGDFSGRVPTAGSDEVSEVGRNINVMLDVLERSQKELRASEARLQELLTQESGLRREREDEIRKYSDYTRALVHELKTPLTAMIASSELLAEEAREEPLASMARNVHHAGLDLNNRIDELLDLARGEVGLLTLKRQPVDVKRLLEQLTDELKPLAETKEQSFVLEIPGVLPVVMADPVRYRQIVINLVGNAFKYTPRGSHITIRSRAEAGSIVTEVQDNGAGIAAEELPNLFVPYSRIRKDASGRHSGLGIGLSLCKRLVELHGGRIWAKSEVGKGSTFGFSIPLAREG